MLNKKTALRLSSSDYLSVFSDRINSILTEYFYIFF